MWELESLGRDIFPLLDDVHAGFVRVRTCADVFLIGYIYVPPSSFDQLLASQFSWTCW